MRILVFKSKYGVRYYDAGTPERLNRSALAILTTLVDDGWVCEPAAYQPAGVESDFVGLSKAEVQALPPSIRASARLALDRIARAEVAATEELERYHNLIALVSGETPYRLRCNRASLSETEWAEGLQDQAVLWPNAMIDDAGIWLPITAWSVLQDRNGFEYEDYSLSTVVTFDEA